MNNEIREPVQWRSIEKKNRIIECGFKLICENGYYNTNTAEIAKASGVSTGIVYQYFRDKRDILLEGIKLYANTIFYPDFSSIEENVSKDNLYDFFSSIVNSFITNHQTYKNAHEALTAVAHSDEQFAEEINSLEMDVSNSFLEMLQRNGFNENNLKEKVHIAMNLIEDLCHEVIYHQHPTMNYDAMKEEVINTLCYLLS